ncbi:hypothetical protein CR513_30448, partial [Mucuna pruriens]
MMIELCKQFKIQHHNSTPYCPKMNGVVEVANKNIKMIIQKMVTSIGATPYSLVYGMEVVLPIELEILSFRVLAEAKLEEAEWVQELYDQLNLIKEKRLVALCRNQLY